MSEKRGFIMIFSVPRKWKKLSIAMILGVIIVFGAACGAYLFQPSFRQAVNMRLNTVSQHRYIINNQSFYLPLPNKTILCYRTSDTQAVYTTKASFHEILTFYSSVAENDSLVKSNEGEQLRLLFQYHGESFIVTAEDCTDSRKMTVAAVSEDVGRFID